MRNNFFFRRLSKTSLGGATDGRYFPFRSWGNALKKWPKKFRLKARTMTAIGDLKRLSGILGNVYDR